MKYKVIGHQYRNDQCLVCGWDNPLGLDLEFWELELSRPGPRRHYFRPVGRADWPRRLHSGTAQLGCNGGLEH